MLSASITPPIFTLTNLGERLFINAIATNNTLHLIPSPFSDYSELIISIARPLLIPCVFWVRAFSGFAHDHLRVFFQEVLSEFFNLCLRALKSDFHFHLFQPLSNIFNHVHNRIIPNHDHQFATIAGSFPCLIEYG